MTTTEMHAIVECLRALVDNPHSGGKLVSGTNAQQAKGAPRPMPASAIEGAVWDQADEARYQRYRARLIDELRSDPILLKLLSEQNEMVVEVERREQRLNGSTLAGRVGLLIADGWFNEVRTTGGCRRQLAMTGTDPGGGGGLSTVLGDFVKQGFLVRAGEGYTKVAGIKVTRDSIATE